MLQISDYKVFIFDCDGVILDSNQLKIEAMKDVLSEMSFSQSEISQCVNYFSNNFGKSRFHHIEYFCQNILSLTNEEKLKYYRLTLSSFATKCEKLYLKAKLTEGILELLNRLNGIKYVASGSAQEELISIFEKRKLSDLFENIYGSPKQKSDIVRSIVERHKNSKIIMIGDAVSDFIAAKNNDIEFLAYIPLSNVKDKMLELSKINRFNCIYDWNDL